MPENLPEVHSFTFESTELERLDIFLHNKLRELSRSYIQKLIKQGFVKVNGRKCKAGHLLKYADKIEVSLPSYETSEEKCISIEPEIVYEDNDIIVINKPAGVVVHPAPGHINDTLINILLKRYPEIKQAGTADRPGIVHRLDKDTSGLMIIARNRRSYENLIEQFKNRRVKKTYLVLIKGKIEPRHGIIDAPIGRHPSNRKKIAVVEYGRPATTKYRVVRYINDCTLLEATPETGRTHQIRVHFSAIGFPVIGDKVYGIQVPWLNRQFLHAWRLGFYLPSSGNFMEIEAGLPDDLNSVLK